MKVEFIDSMGNDLTIVNSARVSFDKTSDWEQMKDIDGVTHKILSAKDAKLIRYLAEHNHFTPFCHATVTFRITTTFYVARQLFKHKVGGVENEVSRRYVDSAPTLDVPTEWRKRAPNVKQGSSDELVRMDDATLKQIEDTMAACTRLYDDLLLIGVCPEQARAVLPMCTETSWVWTGSLMFWARLCNQRLDSHAQKETRDVAKEISNIMSGLFPECWTVLVG